MTMVKDHRPLDNRLGFRIVAPPRSSLMCCAALRYVRYYLAIASLLLAQPGCQSVVDPGRSMGRSMSMPAQPPPGGTLISPPSLSPQLPPPPTTDQSGVVRQPAAAVIQLPQTAAGESKYHTVVAGDNWTSIARQYQLTVDQLTEANGIDPATKLQPGQMVYIPEK